MSKIAGFILTLCLVNFACCGVTDLVPKYVKDKTRELVPDGIYDLTSNVLYGPPPPSAELMAAKRFALEAEMAGDPVKLNNLRIELFNILHKNIQDPRANNIQMQVVVGNPSMPAAQNGGKPSFLQSKISSVFNSAAQTLQPKITMKMQPEVRFGAK